MNRRPNPRTTRTAALAAALLLGPLALSACSGGAEAQSAADALDPGGVAAPDPTDVPEECREAFPLAVGRADESEVSLMPAGWPRDAVEATLCQTSESGSGLQVASYATSETPTQVLDAVRGALPASYDVVRQDQGLGEQLDGSGEGVSFRVTVREGAYEVTFGEG